MQVTVDRVSKTNDEGSFSKEVVLYLLHEMRYVRRPGRNGQPEFSPKEVTRGNEACKLDSK
jgi:hypothetical protein